MIRDAESVLKLAIVQTLYQCMGEDSEVDVVYHLRVQDHIEQSQQEDEEGMPQVVITQSPIWMLNLHFTHRDREIANYGWLPYHYCSDGDVQPMRLLVRELWHRFQFAYMMLGEPSDYDQSIEAVLKKVAEEAERGT